MKRAIDAVSKVLFGHLFRKARDPVLFGQGNYDFDIIGESHYQDTLIRLAGGRKPVSAHIKCMAFIAPEKNNPADKNAVVVMIDWRPVGHLGREHAPEVRRRLNKLGVPEGASCRALICGGWDAGCGDEGDFGVKLDIVWPLCLEAT